jgi:hypothetical protein
MSVGPYLNNAKTPQTLQRIKAAVQGFRKVFSGWVHAVFIVMNWLQSSLPQSARLSQLHVRTSSTSNFVLLTWPLYRLLYPVTTDILL